MRAIAAQAEKIIAGDAQSRAEFLRVEVKDSGGSWQALDTYPGIDMVLGAEVSANLDQPTAIASVRLLREIENLSFAPLMQNSAINRAFNPAASYSPLLALAREIKIHCAIEPADASAATYVTLFHGYIDAIDPASGDNELLIESRDLGAKLVDTFIENERVYGFAEDGASNHVGCRIWEPNTPYVLNEYIVPSDTKRKPGGSYHFYKVTTAGTSGATEPSWSTGGGSTTSSGTCVFTEKGATSPGTGFPVEEIIQGILDDNGLSSITLNVPSSPGWEPTQYLQTRQPVMEAIRALAAQIGWDIRYVWDSGSSTFKLTLYEPDRTPAGTARTFTSAQYEAVTTLKQDISGIRNVVRVIYSDASDLDGANNPKRKQVTSSDSTSISTYGRRFMEIGESFSSLIDSSSEAQTMADACVADLKDPVVQQSVKFAQGFPWVELGDYYQFSANDRHYSSAQNLAVFAYRHSFSDHHMETTIDCRGAPVARYEGWHEIGTRKNKHDVHQLVPFESAPPPVMTVDGDVVGGANIYIDIEPGQLAHGEEFEYHVGSSSGFTPDSTTLIASAASRQVTVSNLIPGETYYAKIVTKTRNGRRIARSQPSDAVSFTAGRAQSGHLDAKVSSGLFPYNFGFEHSSGGSALPPDHWRIRTGTWGTDFDTDTDANGGTTLRFKTGSSVAQKVESAPFPVEPNQRYNLYLTTEQSGTNGGSVMFRAVVYFWKDTAGTVASSILASTTHNINNTVASGSYYFNQQTIPADCNYVTIVLEKASAASSWVIEISHVHFQHSKMEPEIVTTPSLSNSWVDYGGSDLSFGYWKDSSSIVHLRGRIKDGVAATVVTLPSGYRPNVRHIFPIVSAGAFAYVTINTDGTVVLSGYTASDVSLNGIYFRLVGV